MTVSATNQGLKMCNGCNTKLELSKFTLRSTGKYTSRCRACNALASAKYRANNRELYLAKKREARRKRQEAVSRKTITTNWDNLSLDEKESIGCGIYCITINEYFYIGSCINFKERMHEHTRKLGYGNHFNRFMQNSFNKYQMFEAELIEPCHPLELEAVEQKYIDQWFDHEKCLNLRPNVHTMLGFKHSEETKQRLSSIFMGVNSRRRK